MNVGRILAVKISLNVYSTIRKIKLQSIGNTSTWGVYAVFKNRN